MGFLLCYILPLVVLHLVFALIGGFAKGSFSQSGMFFGLIPCIIVTIWNRDIILFGLKMHTEGVFYVEKPSSYISNRLKFITYKIKQIYSDSAGLDKWLKTFWITFMSLITILLMPIMTIQDILFYICNKLYFSNIYLKQENDDYFTKQKSDKTIVKQEVDRKIGNQEVVGDVIISDHYDCFSIQDVTRNMLKMVTINNIINPEAYGSFIKIEPNRNILNKYFYGDFIRTRQVPDTKNL